MGRRSRSEGGGVDVGFDFGPWACGASRGASRGANEDGRGAVESILNGHGQKRSEAGKVGSDTNAMKRIALALALGLPRALCRRGD